MFRINQVVGNYRNGLDLDFEVDDDRTRFRVESKSAVVVHLPTNTSKSIKTRAARGITVRRPKPYLDRNRDIVDETDQLVAAPGDME